MDWHLLRDFAFVFLIAAGASAGLIVLLKPLLVRYALARPNARSSHRIPIPQGGGLAVVLATLLAVLLLATPGSTAVMQWLPIAAAVVLLAVVGAVDDIFTIAIVPRLILQFLAVLAVVTTLPEDMRIVPILPWWIERMLVVICGVWLVNIVNFMDGIDWMTVAEIVPVTTGLALLSLLGALSPLPSVAAVALLGAMLGFAPFNRPVAKLFLGDVGSLPIGLLMFWLLLELAGRGYLTAALLLPLYYLADATITLLRRFLRGEKITQAHRTHFYQLALERGFSVPEVVTRVFPVNVVLVALALASAWISSLLASIVALTLGTILVGGLLVRLSRGKR